MTAIQIVGAGPAGSAAAIAALGEAGAVHIIDRARATRHKVCGEFLSAEACHELDALGVWPAFLGCGPSRIRRAELHFGSRVKRWSLPETAFGLSRLALDGLLLERAVSLGAAVSRGVSWRGAEAHDPVVLACGRRATSSRKPRLFGFKAHFEGPVNDAVELYFAGSSYAGVSAVENHFTNVCGIAPEDELRKVGFEIDEFLARSAPLAERLRPLTRRMEWLTTGPLDFSRLTAPPDNAYPAGDALGFVDPFTGSGILNALVTGRMAGRAAARRTPVKEYFGECRELLGAPVAVAAFFRTMIQSGWAGGLAGLVPGRWMYRLTRVPQFLN